MPKVFNKRRKIKELDKLWSIKVKERDCKCLKCGKKTDLQAAHIFPRTKINTRFDINNGITLCKRCHLYWAHKNPVEFTVWIEYKLGEKKFNELYKKSKKIKAGGFSKRELEDIETKLK